MGISNSLDNLSRIFEDFVADKVLKINKCKKDFEKLTNNFEKSQNRILNEIIEDNEGCRWGRKHKFSKLNHKTWKNHPIITYQELEPYINRIKEGDMHALTNEVPEFFALTSGTTSNPKFIPLTKSSIKDQKKASDVWNLKALGNFEEELRKILILNGGKKNKQTELLPIDSYTKKVKDSQPFYIQKRFIFNKKMESISDLEHRLLLAAQQAFIRQPASLISVNPLTILRLLELTDENRAEIGRATEREKYVGTDIPIGRINNKEHILANIFSKNPLESINFIGTWLGGTQYLFIDKLKEKGVNADMRDLGYIATEGRFTIPIENNTPGGVLNPFGNFYEFMDLENKEIILNKELEKGKEYSMLITKRNGLYRYDMKDVVQMEGWYNSAPMISFKRKEKGFSSLTGEKLHENHVLKLFEELGINKGFLIAKKDPPHYDLVLNGQYNKEFNDEKIDGLLQKINPEYEGKRENNRLKCLNVYPMDQKEFQKLDKRINPYQEHDRFKKKYLVSFRK